MTRGNWLLLVSEGMAEPNEVIAEAAKPHGAALLKLRLRQLVMTHPDWGEGRSSALVAKIVRISGSKVPASEATIGWLLDRRSGGRRFAAWLDSIEEKSGTPCSGFPFRLEVGVK
ncbi:hypothetical protein LG293_16300 (plasmid) [Citricoccus nitrophenolicus]